MSERDVKNLQKTVERILQLVSIAFIVGAFNTISFAYDDEALFISCIVLIAISVLLFILSRCIASTIIRV